MSTTYKKCIRCQTRRPVYRFHKAKHNRDGLRRECSSCSAELKAEMRARPQRPVEPRDGIYWVTIPCERVLPLFMEYLGNEPYKRDNDPSLVRAVHRMQHEVSEVRFDFVDRWLARMGMEHLWHTPPETGGLSDFYHFDERVLASSSGSGGLSRGTFGCGTGESRAGSVPPPSAEPATPSQRKAA